MTRRHQEPLDTRLPDGTLTICLPSNSVGARLAARHDRRLAAGALGHAAYERGAARDPDADDALGEHLDAEPAEREGVRAAWRAGWDAAGGSR